MESIFAYIKRRVSFTNPYGFWFTSSCIACVVFFICFFVLALNKPIAVDIRIMNLIASIRTIEDANLFLFMTYLGNVEIIVSLGLIITCALWLLRRYRHSFLVFAGIIAGYGVSEIMKLLVRRNRPDIFYALIKENGFSFPSGHATVSVVFYGIIAYLLYKIARYRWQKLIIILCALSLVFCIGFSRMYLGVHWFSDVLAGWLLGLSVLFFLIVLLKGINILTEYELQNIPIIRRRRAFGVIAIFLFLEGCFVLNYYFAHPLEVPAVFDSQPLVFISQISDFPKVFASDEFPKFSETITGKKMEPVSLILIGSLENLSQIFHQAGWYVSDRRVGTVFRLALTAFLNRPDPTAFITPAFLKATPDAIAFEKPTVLNTVRQRHHTRFWATNFVFQGAPVWVATTSFDISLRYFITHKISPDIDTERDFIKNDLLKTGLIKQIQEIQLVKPNVGKNQIGDIFFTGGKAYLLFLK